MLCTHMLVTTEDNTVNRRWHRVTICRSPGEQHNIRGIVVSRNRALCGKTARALGNPKVRQRLPPLPLLSPRGGQTEYHGSMETLAVYPFARSRSGRERTWRLPPTRFQQHCRLIPHDKGPSYPSNCIHFWRPRARATWARAAESDDERSSRRMETSLPCAPLNSRRSSRCSASRYVRLSPRFAGLK